MTDDVGDEFSQKSWFECDSGTAGRLESCILQLIGSQGNDVHNSRSHPGAELSVLERATVEVGSQSDNHRHASVGLVNCADQLVEEPVSGFLAFDERKELLKLVDHEQQSR